MNKGECGFLKERINKMARKTEIEGRGGKMFCFITAGVWNPILWAISKKISGTADNASWVWSMIFQSSNLWSQSNLLFYVILYYYGTTLVVVIYQTNCKKAFIGPEQRDRCNETINL